MRAFKFRLHIDFSGKRIDLFTAALLRFRRRLVTTMLLFTVLATLLGASMVDGRLAPVDSTEALALCQSQPKCKNPAVEISPTFFPIVKAPASKVNVRLAVKSKEPLTFPIKAEKDLFTWEIRRSRDNCKWKITSYDGVTSFKDKERGALASCNSAIGDVVKFAIRVEGTGIFVDATGKECEDNQKNKELTACNAPPDSDSIPGSHVWTLTISASTPSDIPLENAYAVYNAPDPTTITPNASFDGNVTTLNPNSTTHKPGSSTADVGLSITTYALIVVSALLAVL